MNFFKFIFGRFFIISLLVVIQVVGFITATIYLDRVFPYYYLVSLGFSVVGILIVLVLINRQINPNHIVPWIVIILAMPVPGVALYLMFSQNRLSRKEKKKYREIHEKSQVLLKQNPSVLAQLGEKDKKAYGQSRYLSSSSKMPVYYNECCKYFPSGESFFARLKEELRKAQRFIFMEFFIVDKGMMWDSVLEILVEKIEQGVEVRFMYDDIGSISTVSSGFYKKLRGLGIKCVKFNKFLPIISAVHNNRDHRKNIVIDGETGFVCGANLADEYINAIEKYGHWKDSAVMIKGEAVKSLSVMFLQMYNAQIRHAEVQDDFSCYLPSSSLKKGRRSDDNDNGLAGEEDGGNNQNIRELINEQSSDRQDVRCGKSSDKGADQDSTDEDSCKSGGFVQPFGYGPMPLYIEKVGQTAIINMLAQAERYIYITTPYLIVDFQLTEAIKCAARRGVDVRIITPHIPDKKLIFMMTRSAYRALLEAGVKVYEYLPGFMHSKNYIADDKLAIVGTMNLDYRSLVHHFECGVWMYDTPCIADILSDFNAALAVSHEVSQKEARLNPLQRLVRVVLELFAPLL